MEMRSATALRNDYDGMVRLSKEAQEAELDLLAEMLRREKSMLSGRRTHSQAQMKALAEDILRED